MQIGLNGFRANGPAKSFQISGRIDPVHGLFRMRKPGSDAEPFGFVGMAGELQEFVEIIDVSSPEFTIDLLFGREAGRIPIAGEQRFAREQFAECGILEPLAFPLVMQHNVQQRFQRRTSLFDAVVVEVHLRDAFLRGDDVVHAISKDLHTLKFRTKHFLGEDGVRMVRAAAHRRPKDRRPRRGADEQLRCANTVKSQRKVGWLKPVFQEAR